MTFEEKLPELINLIDQRKPKWLLNEPAFEDVRQIVLIHFFEKFDTFDPLKGEFNHWANRTITNQIRNLVRNNMGRWQRPCLHGCVYNLGGDGCGYTKSGKQCLECPLFKKWSKTQEKQFQVKQSLPLEHHIQEVNSLPCESIDAEKAKEILDIKLKELLTESEWKMYELIYIKHMTPKQAGKKLKLKVPYNSDIPGYQMYNKLKHKVVALSRQIIIEEGLA